MGAPRIPRKGKQIERAMWTAEAVRLACMGWSYRRIAAKVGKHWTSVAKTLQDEFERVRPTPEEVATRRALLSEQLEEQMQRWRVRALSGDTQSAQVLVRLYERYTKLWGADAPELKDVRLVHSEATPAEAARIARELFGSHAARDVDDEDRAGDAETPEEPAPPDAGD